MSRICVIASLLFLSNCAATAAERAPLRVALYSGSVEYSSRESLEKFQKLLQERLGAKCVLFVVEEKGTTLTGVEELNQADVAIFFTRRVSLAEDQLARVRKFISAGKGVVGVRTASHGFQTWLEFDAQILGGSYSNHYRYEKPATVSIVEQGKTHPVLKGIKPFETVGKLYKNPKLAADVTLLLRAKSAEAEEPVAWVREPKAGERGRVFYTSLGTAKDFEEQNFCNLLVNAVAWCAGLQP